MRYRSWLWTSALQPISSKKILNPDVWIIDLEDSVPKNMKDKAREAIPSWLNQRKSIKGLRINSINLSEGLKDILFLLDNNIEPDIIVIPKIQSAAEISIVDNLLHSTNKTTKLCATIETLKSLDDLNNITRASKRLFALIFGAADFSVELGVEICWKALLYARQKIAIAAAAANLLAIDAPCFYLHNDYALKKECKMAKILGYKGKAAINPSQIEYINQLFSVSETDLDHAKLIIRTAENSKTGIACVEGRMIGPPFILNACKVVEMAGEEFNEYNK